MRRIVAFLIVLILCVSFSACGNGSDNNVVETEETSVETMETIIETTVAETEVPLPVIFESDDLLNQFFISYNEIADYPIEAENVKKGNIRTKAIVSIGGLYMEIVHSGNDFISFDITDKEEMDDELFPVFRDFLRVMNSELTIEEIETAWSDIQSHYYEIDYNNVGAENVYDMGGVQLQFMESSNYNRYSVRMLYWLD